MSLSKVQTELLNKCQVPEPIQQAIGKYLDENGNPKRASDPDFLSTLGNHLRIAEHELQHKRILLGIRINDKELNDLGERTPGEMNLEEEIKAGWAVATALWRAADQVVSKPELYSTQLTINHIRYALAHKNLPIVEMIRWSKPEYFEAHPPHHRMQFSGRIFGFLGGAILGIFGGFLGGARHGYEKHPVWGFLWAPLYAVISIFTGSAQGASTGATFGYETGSGWYGMLLGLNASFNNPQNEPAGSKYQQEVELQKQLYLFKLAERRR